MHDGIFVLLKRLPFHSRKYLQGIECPGVVIISSTITGSHCMDVISRCSSYLVLVTNESELENLKHDRETFHIIQVQGDLEYCLFFPMFR